MQENGVIVTIAAVSNSVTFAVTTAQGNFSFASTWIMHSADAALPD
jgi:hypothetical protein